MLAIMWYPCEIWVKALFKPTYEVNDALSGVSLDVGRGEILGYIGPNGAGKSTTIKILCGILLPTAGDVQVMGKDPFKFREQNAKDIGVVFGQRSQLWWNIPAIESLELNKHVYRINEQRFRKNLEMFIELLDMDSFINTPVRYLSLGQKMRVDICASLLHDPEILFLDEPTIGLDIVAKECIRKFIKEVSTEKKVTVILTTHDLADIEKLCSRVVLIDKGILIYDNNIQLLKDKFSHEEVISFVTELPISVENISIPGVNQVEELSDRKYKVLYNKQHTTPMNIIETINSHTRILDFTLQTTELESIISQIYRAGYTEKLAL